METVKTQIPLKAGQQFMVKDEKGCQSYVFTVKSINPAASNPNEAIFTAFVDDLKGKRQEHLLWFWPEKALMLHATKKQLLIKKSE